MGGQSHTAGPWSVEAPYTSEVQTSGGLTIATCWYADADGAEITVTGVLPCSVEESAANARLIAAAPELLEALRHTTELLASINRSTDRPSSHVSRRVTKARAAIAKATGEQPQ